MLMVTHFQVWGVWFSKIPENSHCSCSSPNPENFKIKKKKTENLRNPKKNSKSEKSGSLRKPQKKPFLRKKNAENLKVAQASAPKVTLEEALDILAAFGVPPLAALTVETSVPSRVEPGGSRDDGSPVSQKMREWENLLKNVWIHHDTSRLSRKWISCLDRISIFDAPETIFLYCAA